MSDATIWNAGCGDCGATLLNGEGAPAIGLGDEGFFYLDTLNTILYGPKLGDDWGAGVILIGPIGASGPIGLQGIQGNTGIQGIKGSQGLQGVTGATGATGLTGPAGTNGAAGTQVLSGVINPTLTDGVTGDYFLNLTTSFLWGPRNLLNGWVGTGIPLKGATGATGATGTPGIDQPLLPLDIGQQIATLNTTVTAMIAAADSTLVSNADYTQLTGIFEPVPHGINQGITQQANQLTVTRSGVYAIRVWATASASSNNVTIAFKFTVNGTLPLLRRASTKLGNAGDKNNLAAFGYANLVAGDIVTLWHACTATTNLTYYDVVFGVEEMIATGVYTIPYLDEGVSVLAVPTSVNFVGQGVTVTAAGAVATVTIPGENPLTVQDEGSVLTPSAVLMNFAGPGVVVTSPVAGEVLVTIPGTDTNTTDLVVQEEGTPVVTAGVLNFVGAGVTVTDVAGVATATIPGPPAPVPVVKHTNPIIFDPVISSVFSLGFFGGRYIVVEQDGTIDSLAFAAVVANGTSVIYPAVYAKAVGSNEPGTLLATGPALTGAVQGINIAALAAPLTVTAGTILVIGLVVQTFSLSMAASPASTRALSFATAGAPPATAPTVSHSASSTFGTTWPVMSV
jgi:hypothetical protein